MGGIIPSSSLFKVITCLIILILASPFDEQQHKFNDAHCPCSDRSGYEENYSNQFMNKLCIVDNEEAKIYSLMIEKIGSKIPLKIVPSNLKFTSELVSDCDSIIEFSNNETIIDKHKCPGHCKPIPITTIPISWIMNFSQKQSNYSLDQTITCTMTWRQFFASNNFVALNLSSQIYNTSTQDTKISITQNQHSFETIIATLLDIIITRRFEECNEPVHWKYKQSVVSKRHVFGLIIWAGSRSRMDMLERQVSILRDQKNDNEHTIVGWMATEDQYDCGKNANICIRDNYSLPNFPGTILTASHPLHKSEGWACGQRRPPRSMSHALLLYEPQFLLVGDDDTYINPKILFSTDFKSYVKDTLSIKNMVLGCLSGDGSMSKLGFFFGGCGYIFSKLAISMMNSYTLPGPTKSSNGYTNPGNQKLYFLFQAKLLAEHSCPMCINDIANYNENKLGMVAMTKDRLIDICINLMAKERTCYHSDHILSRFIFYGLLADVIDMPCENSVKTHDIIDHNITFGMCMGRTEYSCDHNRHMTCHRFQADRHNATISESTRFNIEKSNEEDKSHNASAPQQLRNTSTQKQTHTASTQKKSSNASTRKQSHSAHKQPSHNASAWSGMMPPETATEFLFKESGKNYSVLVIVNGQLRGGNIAWNSMQEHLLDFYHADLALIGPPFTPTEDKDLIALRNRAKFVWTQPELDDWGEVLDTIGNSSSWRELCTYRKSPNCTKQKNSAWQFLGGVKNCHEGSSGILLAYRYLTLQKILQTSILDDYDWIIYTRADYTYLCSPLPLSYFSSDYVYVPNSQGFGGITDRHTYIPRKFVTRVLNITEHIVINSKFWLNKLCSSDDKNIRNFNLERTIFWYFNFVGIPFKRFWHSAFTVRRDEDPTRWQEGHVHHIMNKYTLKVKYPGEVDEANISCDPWKRFFMTHPLPH